MVARNFAEAFSQIQKLVAEFRQNEAQFLSPAYSEAAVRTDFINRFWIALGWDVTHETQKNPHACEVSVERNVNVEGRGKRADYSFSVAPNYRDVRFFVEAKKPSRQLDNAQDYFQTMRYGWHARTPVAVLMDFEQLRVLDCRYKPDIDAVLQYGALEKFHYTDYADEEKFRRLYHLFSREDVERGALEAYAARLAKPGRRGVQAALFAKGAYQSIDESFLQDLDGYREQLARAFKQDNPQLDGAQLTEATQRTLDRLVFMRFLEDKLIETDELVERFALSHAPWAEFVAASRRLDRVYNGIIFKEHALLDAPAFRVDERAFAGICENLSHARSPYDFNLIPIHILGSIYERFLSRTIDVIGGEACVVPKPEVRKAGGVYYTPEYIVRYIVEQTVGQLIAGKTPEEIRPLRFADISCGSGSFLLGVFDLLLAYHAGYYNRNRRTRAEGLKAGCTETDEGTLRLSLLQKRTILLNNIYGVDVDAQAVEVAQLSLYLKLLEAETTATTRTHQLAFRQALLPALNQNIVCGNSLIDWENIADQLFDKDDLRRINPMSFAQEFPQIMRDGGFDAIVGNPPYRRELDYKELMAEIGATKFGVKYRVARMDLWYYFVHRALELLKPARPLSFIVNAYWTSGTGAEKLIKALREEAHVDEIFFFKKLKVFKEVSGQHMTIRITNAPGNAPTTIKLVEPTKEIDAEAFVAGIAPVKIFRKTPAQLYSNGKIDLEPPSDELLSKLDLGAPLNSLGLIRQGIAENPAAINRKTNEKFGNRWTSGEGVFALRPEEAARLRLTAAEKKLLRPYYDLCDLGRYSLAATPSLALIYSTRTTCPDIEAYPNLRAHLVRFRDIMEMRRETRNGANSWWHLHWPRDETLWESAKILSVQMGARPAFVPVEQPVYVPFSVNVFVPFETTNEHLYYITALLNSRLMWKWYRHHAKRRGIGLEINGNVLARTPIRTINFSDAADEARHERAVSLVAAMLAAKRQLAGAGTDAERSLYERRCAALDAQIDALVYELYALTPPEIALVEAS